MNKSIIVVNNNLSIGGIQKSCVNFVNFLVENFDVSVKLILFDSGPLIDEINDKVKIQVMNYPLKYLCVDRTNIKKEKGITKIKYYICKGISKLFGKRIILKTIINIAPSIKGKYDIAISYMQNLDNHSLVGGCNEYVLYKINSNRKIAFVHADYSKFRGNNSYNNKLYVHFDDVICCTNSCKQILCSCIPNIKERTHVINNLLNYIDIETKTKFDYLKYDKKYVNFVTVARISAEKGILRCLEAFEGVIKSGFLVKWYVIGSGPDFSKCKKYIEDNSLGDYICLLGEQTNPYRYLVDSDIFILPSFYEAEPMVIKEALFLGIPVITTCTISAYEMVGEKYGVVCENSKDGLMHAIEKMSNKEQIDFYKKNIKGKYLPNSICKNQIMKVFKIEEING